MKRLPGPARVRAPVHTICGLLPTRSANSSHSRAASSATANAQAQAVAPAPQTARADADAWSHLGDRLPRAPVPLPPIRRAADPRGTTTPHDVFIVRHGESTWNAEARVQGSSDHSVLTPKGLAQAHATAEMLSDMAFDQVWFSPLSRATHTAEIVWGDRAGPQHCDPVLREIDLYSFQGLEKAEVRQRYPTEYQDWQTAPERFELDGHLPVKELWYRASLAWQKILAAEAGAASTLVVAHNNTNQALVATALQLPTSFFRRLTQGNAAVSHIRFVPGETPSAAPEAVLLGLNRSVGSPLRGGGRVAARVVLLVVPQDEPGRLACAQLLEDTPVRHVVLLPSNNPGLQGVQQAAAGLLGEVCCTESGGEPTVTTLDDEAGDESWAEVEQLAAVDGGCTVLVVLDRQAAAGLTCSAFGLGQMARHKWHFDAGSVSVFDFPTTPGTRPAAARCLNYTAHLQPARGAASASSSTEEHRAGDGTA